MLESMAEETTALESSKKALERLYEQTDYEDYELVLAHGEFELATRELRYCLDLFYEAGFYK